MAERAATRKARGRDAGTVTLRGGRCGAGGRFVSDWPGLRDLYQDRDLMPANDLRSVALALLRDHPGLPAAAQARAFPGAAVDPVQGLLRA